MQNDSEIKAFIKSIPQNLISQKKGVDCLGLSNFANMLDVERSTVYAWMKEGLPSYPQGGGFTLPIQPAIEWIFDNDKLDGLDTEDADGNVGKEIQIERLHNLRLTGEKHQLEILSKRLKLAVDKRQYVDLEKVRNSIEVIVGAITSEFSSLGPALALPLTTESDVAAIQAMIDVKVDDILASLKSSLIEAGALEDA